MWEKVFQHVGWKSSLPYRHGSVRLWVAPLQCLSLLQLPLFPGYYTKLVNLNTAITFSSYHSSKEWPWLICAGLRLLSRGSQEPRCCRKTDGHRPVDVYECESAGGHVKPKRNSYEEMIKNGARVKWWWRGDRRRFLVRVHYQVFCEES